MIRCYCDRQALSRCSDCDEPVCYMHRRSVDGMMLCIRDREKRRDR